MALNTPPIGRQRARLLCRTSFGEIEVASSRDARFRHVTCAVARTMYWCARAPATARFVLRHVDVDFADGSDSHSALRRVTPANAVKALHIELVLGISIRRNASWVSSPSTFMIPVAGFPRVAHTLDDPCGGRVGKR